MNLSLELVTACKKWNRIIVLGIKDRWHDNIFSRCMPAIIFPKCSCNEPMTFGRPNMPRGHMHVTRKLLHARRLIWKYGKESKAMGNYLVSNRYSAYNMVKTVCKNSWSCAKHIVQEFQENSNFGDFVQWESGPIMEFPARSHFVVCAAHA